MKTSLSTLKSIIGIGRDATDGQPEQNQLGNRKLKSLEEILEMLEHKPPKRASPQKTGHTSTTDEPKLLIRPLQIHQKQQTYCPPDFHQIEKFMLLINTKQQSVSFTIGPGYIIYWNYVPKGRVTKKEVVSGCFVEKVHEGGDVEIRYENGSVVIWKCGEKIVQFKNGDFQHNFMDGSMAYYFKAHRLMHFRMASGQESVFFSDGHKEVRWPNGKIEIYDIKGRHTITKPNGEKKILQYPSKIINNM